jgi:hypothetical protein
VSPYRDAPERRPADPPPRPIPNEEVVLIGLLIFLGGLRVTAAIVAGHAFDAEATIGLAILVLGCWWAGVAIRLRARNRRRSSGVVHDDRS